MGKSFRRTGNHDVAYYEGKPPKSKNKTKEFSKAFKSLSDVEDVDDEELDEFFDEPDM